MAAKVPMSELVAFIARALVQDTGAVAVEEIDSERDRVI